MKMATIFDDVKVTKNRNSDNEIYFDLEFDGVIGSVYGRPSKNVLHAFKNGILSERNRIWDESVDKVEDCIMRNLLRYG